MNIFGMVTTRASQRYTGFAVDSFFSNTEFGAQDEFYLIDNDGGLSLADEWKSRPIQIRANSEPLSFAANLNLILQIAAERRADLYFLNNDLIFTAEWLTPLAGVDGALVSPVSNGQIQYRLRALNCAFAMDLEHYLGCENDLAAIAAAHRAKWHGYRRVLSLPFFCIKIPRKIYEVLGPLDESFGRGGAEDTDYCLRAYLAGFETTFALGSYVLHFQGKSTWRGAETSGETKARNAIYLAAFEKKWGAKLARLAIVEGEKVLAADPEFRRLAEQGAFKELIERLK